jgi:hypothetical protein
MYIRITIPVKSINIIQNTIAFESGQKRFHLHTDENGLCSAVSIEMKSTSNEDYPKITKINNVTNINTSSPTVGMLMDIARTAEGLLSMYGISSFEFQNSKIDWLPESDEEKQSLNVFSFSISTQAPTPVPADHEIISLLLQGLISADRAQETQIPLNFFKRGNIAANQGTFINAFYEYYFMIESEYGNGKYKETAILKEFKKSKELVSYTQKVKSLDRTLLFTTHEASLINNKYRNMSFDQCWKEIISLRGKLHHHSKLHPKKWNPHIHQPYEVDVTFLRQVCSQLASEMFNRFALDEQTLNTLRKGHVKQEVRTK